MRIISTGVAAVFLVASSFGALAAPAASSAQGVKTGTAAITVEDTSTAPKAKKPMHHKSTMHTRRRRHLTSMHHKPMHHPTRTKAKSTGAPASTY